VASFLPVGAVGLDGALARQLRASEASRGLPTLVVWGERDLPESSRAQLFTDTFVNARKVVLQGAGHACYNDDPEAFHAELLAWLAQPAATAAAAATPTGDLRA
jgi:pimeloyl-ACP methyl ester carboxylesterase